VQDDLAKLMKPMGEGMVIAGTCNGWQWDPFCAKNGLYTNAENWRDGVIVYLNKDKEHLWPGCVDDGSEVGGYMICQSSEYEPTVSMLTEKILGYPVNFTAQKRWNFGMARFNLSEWRRANMSHVFNAFLKANYDLKIWPETSLSFGLGISYLAFSDRIACWNDLVDMPFREGLGYAASRLARSGTCPSPASPLLSTRCQSPDAHLPRLPSSRPDANLPPPALSTLPLLPGTFPLRISRRTCST
jgi:hypothetical protein